VVLCGVRNLRDYRIHSSAGREVITGGSAFNIKAASLRLGDFSTADVAALLGQHTDETGQAFTAEALARVWSLTRGQPWLVNALADVACFRLPAGRDRARSIDVNLIDAAKEELILRRVTHLDQLADKLREERVRRIIEPMLAGNALGVVPEEDRDYLVDLGLLRRTDGGGLVIANPIYREVLPRVLASGPQDSLPQISPSWLDANGDLDSERSAHPRRAGVGKERFSDRPTPRVPYRAAPAESRRSQSSRSKRIGRRDPTSGPVPSTRSTSAGDLTAG
jgi:hypothetical protein